VGYGEYGQRGDGTTTPNSYTWVSPVYNGGTTPLSNIVEIQSNGFDGGTTCYALDSAGKLWGWGHNYFGQLGTGNTTNQTKAVEIGFRTGRIITDFWACGSYYANALFVKYDDDKIFSCGANTLYQIGHTSTANILVLTEVTALSGLGIKEIVMSGGSDTQYSHTVAVTSDDRLLFSGNNVAGQCSVGTNSTLQGFEYAYTILNNTSSPIKLKSGISRDNPYIDLKHMATQGGTSWILSNNNDVYTCGFGRYLNTNASNENLFYLSRVKHWM
jgi:alpha-tubulin suppressor-like RCC1 family protein